MSKGRILQVVVALVATALGALVLVGCVPRPVIYKLTPATGGTAGGNVVILSGGSFTAATAVSFGGTPAASFVVNGPKKITAVAPPGAIGTVEITVSAGATTSLLRPSDKYTYHGCAAFAGTDCSYVDLTGSDLVNVVVTGSNYNYANMTNAHASGADFADSKMTGANLTGADLRGANFTNVVFTDASLINADLTNANLTGGDLANAKLTGAVFCNTTMPDGSINNSGCFPVPTVSAVDANTGGSAGGYTVTITGTHFTDATAVRFGGVLAPAFAADTATQISVLAPHGALGTVDVTVEGPNGTSPVSGADQFTFTGCSIGSDGNTPGPYSDCSFVDLSRQDLHGRQLGAVVFHGADLSYANLSGANVAGAEVNGANLSHTNLSGATIDLSTFISADLDHADLSGSHMQGGSMLNADLSNANATNGYFISINFTSANLSYADFTGALLYQPNLTFANRTGTIGCIQVLDITDPLNPVTAPC